MIFSLELTREEKDKSRANFKIISCWFSSIRVEMFGVTLNKRRCGRVLEITNDQEEKAKLSVEDIKDPINMVEVVASNVNELKSLDVLVDHVVIFDSVLQHTHFIKDQNYQFLKLFQCV